MASNDNNGKRNLEEEVESLAVRKRLRLSDEDGGDDDSFNSLEEDTEEEEVEDETEEEVSLEESSMNQLDTSEETLLAKRGQDPFFGDDGDNTSPSSEPCTPETLSSRVHSDPNGSDDDDDNDGDVDF
jgi:hypothetical protein